MILAFLAGERANSDPICKRLYTSATPLLRCSEGRFCLHLRLVLKSWFLVSLPRTIGIILD